MPPRSRRGRLFTKNGLSGGRTWHSHPGPNGFDELVDVSEHPLQVQLDARHPLFQGPNPRLNTPDGAFDRLHPRPQLIGHGADVGCRYRLSPRNGNAPLSENAEIGCRLQQLL
jgi:hypothetical protein